jgi:signal peptidase I
MRKLPRLLVTLTIVLGILIGGARAVAIRWWQVPNDDPYLEASVAPTLRGGDLILLWRLTAPHSGDLVLCPEPKQPDRVVIGRIAAVQGESIEIDGHSLRVNGHNVKSESKCFESRFTAIDPQTKIPLEQVCQDEELGTRLHQRGNVRGEPPPKVTDTVGAGMVYLVSDNRQMPYDSRDFGPVERATCKEMVFFRLFSGAGWGDTAHRLSLIR